MIAGLKSGPFFDSLARRLAETLDEFRHHVVGYINIEEFVAAKYNAPLRSEKVKAPARDLPSRKEKKNSLEQNGVY